MSDSTWQEDLFRSFGVTDRKFGGHAMERVNARLALRKIAEQEIRWSEVEAEVHKILAKEAPKHVATQLANVTNLRFYLED